MSWVGRRGLDQLGRALGKQVDTTARPGRQQGKKLIDSAKRMGNSATSGGGMVPALGKVQVLQPDGKVLHFEHPILAIQVMQEHPGHLLIRCCASMTFDKIKELQSKQGRVAMLRVDEELDPRSNYFLLPVKTKEEESKQQTTSVTSPGGWKCFFGKAGKVGSSLNIDKDDSSRGDKKFSLLRRSRSVPRDGDCSRPIHLEQQQKLSPSVSFPPRTGHQSFESFGGNFGTNGGLGSPFMQGTGRFRELPPPMQQRFQHKRPRRMRRPSSLTAWRPILESISETGDEFSDDEEFGMTQPKCLRRHHTFHSHLDSLSTTGSYLRPVAVA